MEVRKNLRGGISQERRARSFGVINVHLLVALEWKLGKIFVVAFHKKDEQGHLVLQTCTFLWS